MWVLSLFIAISVPPFWLGFPTAHWRCAKCCQIYLPTSLEVFRKGELAEKQRYAMKWENWNGCSESNLCYYFCMTLVPQHRCTCTDIWRREEGGATEGITSLVERYFHVHIVKDWSFLSQCMHWKEVVFFYSAKTLSMILIGPCDPALLKHKLESKWSFFFFLDNDQSWTEQASGGSKITRSCFAFILPSCSDCKFGFERRAKIIYYPRVSNKRMERWRFKKEKKATLPSCMNKSAV